jgi:vacuolar iron transporter family protein
MEKHLQSSDFIKDVVIGMADGLTVPFALAAGLSGAVSNTSIITTAGIAEIVAGAIAMGLGGYLAGQTEVEHYDAELKREYEEVERVPETEKEEVKEVFAAYGLDENAQNLVVEALSKDKDNNRARDSGLTIGLSYIVGGIIPLSPYFFLEDAHVALNYSVIVTLITLFVFGYFKSKVTDQDPIKGAFKVMLIGALAAGAAFYVAKLFS